MSKYTFRFYRRVWIDVTVEADNMDDATIAANNAYYSADNKYYEGEADWYDDGVRFVKKED